MKSLPEIECELLHIETSESIRIVFACESGSRAWGFESQDSDYDVRFIYVHPAYWHLRVEPGPDVIECPMIGHLDIAGWDIRKALQLLRKSNPPLLEWLQSPIVYREAPQVVSRIRELMPVFYSPAACHYHYLHMAEGNYRDYLRDEQVWTKKYFYVLRPVLACLWIEQGFGVVPIAFSQLVARIVKDESVLEAIERLLERKRAGDELDRGPKIKAISNFLDTEIARLSTKRNLPSVHAPADALDSVFRFAIAEMFGTNIQPPNANP
jgi:predicted nucleotidyltransferase